MNDIQQTAHEVHERKYGHWHDNGSHPKVSESQVSQWQPFPVDLLSPSCSGYVRACAKSLGVDEAFLATLMLPMLGAAIGNSYRITPNGDWVETSCIWSLLSKRSGEGGTPAFKKAGRPVFEIESELHEEYKEKKDRMMEGDSPPVRRRLRIDDITVEAMGRLHEQNPRGLLLATDELSMWMQSFDKYSSGNDRSKWLQVYSNTPLIIDRVSTEGPLRVGNPNVSITGTIQPGILDKEFSPDDFEAGLVPRFLIVEPPASRRTLIRAGVEKSTADKYVELVKHLFNDLPGGDGAPPVLKLEPDAYSEFEKFHGALSEKEANASGPLRSMYSKMYGVCLRLALILQLSHIADAEPEKLPHAPDVSADVMGSAVSLTDWLISEQKRVYKVHGFSRRVMSKRDRFLNALPESFEANEAVEIGDKRGISRATVYRSLTDFQETGRLQKTGHGTYLRVP